MLSVKFCIYPNVTKVILEHDESRILSPQAPETDKPSHCLTTNPSNYFGQTNKL